MGDFNCWDHQEQTLKCGFKRIEGLVRWLSQQGICLAKHSLDSQHEHKIQAWWMWESAIPMLGRWTGKET